MPEPPAEDASPFTLKEWEEIISRSTGVWEARKREYTRWVAVGITSAVALFGLLLEHVPQVELGRDPFLSVILLVVLTYLLVHLGAELLEGRTNSALRTLISAQTQTEGPRKLLETLFRIAELNVRDVLASPVTRSIAFTSTVLLLIASTWPSPISSVFLFLGVWRAAFLALFVAFFFIMRASAKQLLPGRERILEAAPISYPPDYERRRKRIEPLFTLIVVAYYAVQFIPMFAAFQLAVPVTYGLLVLLLLLLGIDVLAVWIQDVAWPLVKDSSEIFGNLRDLHSEIVTGKMSSATSVFAKLKDLEAQIERAREAEWRETHFPRASS